MTSSTLQSNPYTPVGPNAQALHEALQEAVAYTYALHEALQATIAHTHTIYKALPDTVQLPNG